MMRGEQGKNGHLPIPFKSKTDDAKASELEVTATKVTAQQEMCRKGSVYSPAITVCLFIAAIIHSLTMLCQGGPWESSPLLVL